MFHVANLLPFTKDNPQQVRDVPLGNNGVGVSLPCVAGPMRRAGTILVKGGVGRDKALDRQLV